jgi:hypothetical protein
VTAVYAQGETMSDVLASVLEIVRDSLAQFRSCRRWES